jgi:hypothetical protein
MRTSGIVAPLTFVSVISIVSSFLSLSSLKACSGIQVVLASNLPDAALQSLPGIDLLRFTFGPVHYDASASAWLSLFDERCHRASCGTIGVRRLSVDGSPTR